MNNPWLRMCLTASLCLQLGSLSKAAIVIPTNSNGGADAEVREEDINPNGSDVPQGTNRSGNTDLATRMRDSTSNSGDHSSAIYLKFDIRNGSRLTSVLRLQKSMREILGIE